MRDSRRLSGGVLGICGIVILGTCGTCAAIAADAAAPVFSETGPEAAEYGAVEGYPVPHTAPAFDQMLYLVGGYSRFDEVVPTRVVAHASTPWSFKRAAAEAEIAYSFRDARYAIDEYLRRNPVTGLLIVKDDTILYEHYQYARNDRDRFLSQSMAKTITAMLIGIAVSEGAIKSIDDMVAIYVPELAETEYGKTPIRALLHMSSGVAFSETYDGQDDLAKLDRDLFGRATKSTVASVAQFNTRKAPPGTVWHYSSLETEVLGLVLRGAVQKPVADYLRDKIWQQIGTEADASWAIDGNGQEVTFCCFNAVLRDYARFGRLLAHDGTWEGRQIIPRQWVIDATTVRPDELYLAPGGAERFWFYGYGYQVWLLPRPERRFVLLGLRGQMIFVDPASKLVMVQTAVQRAPAVAGAEANTLWSAVVEQLGGKRAKQ
jgi:CubicO group peptidase (beta-lactamase class C family)